MNVDKVDKVDKIEGRIDLVARTMTDAHPSADFRARVMAALPARRPRRWPILALRAAAATLVVTIAWLAGTAAHRTLTPTSGATIALAPAEPINKQMASAASFVVPAVTRRHPSSPVVPEQDPSRLLDPIQPSALSIAPITMEPIALPDPIAIAPIDSRAGGR